MLDIQRKIQHSDYVDRGGLTLAGCQVPTRATLSLPSSFEMGREKITKLVGQDNDGEKPLTNYYHGQNRH